MPRDSEADPAPLNDTTEPQSWETDAGTQQPPPGTPPYFIPRRPRVVRMRDLSPDTRTRLTREYYDAYDPWVGVRIAATLGVAISLFTLFLIYKSRFNRSKAALLPSKKASLYLFDEDPDSAGGSSSSGRSRDYEIAYPYRFPFQEGFQLEEVLVKDRLVDVVALKVHKSGRRRTSREAPPDTEVKAPPDSPASSTSMGGSIASFGSSDVGLQLQQQLGPGADASDAKRPRKFSTSDIGTKAALVVTAKKPQDYRSRSTVVSIARRKKPS